MGGARRKDLGVSARTCHVCLTPGTLRVTETQDTRRTWIGVRVNDREPYRTARCSVCDTVITVRSTDRP